ncbi:hypothetical protein Tco_0575165 [Tanacetum coccineum]
MESSFRRNVRGGIEQHMLEELTSTLETVSLSNSCDRWICDLTSDGVFRVKEVRNCIDDIFLPSQVIETRWVRFVPIKVNDLDLASPSMIVCRRGLTCRFFCEFGRWCELDPSNGTLFRNGNAGFSSDQILYQVTVTVGGAHSRCGGIYGGLGIASFLREFFPDVPRSLIILFFVLSIGVIIVVVKFSHGRIG